MDTSALLQDALGRVREVAADVVDGLTTQQLAWRPDPAANSIGWLVWHLSRVQDDHVADAAGSDQVWLTGGWQERFALGLDPGDTGYGHTADQVGAVQTTAELLAGYLEAVVERSTEFVRGLSAEDLDRVVDRRWDPAVTLGVRLVSVLCDDLQHAGQAAYVRGLLPSG